MSRKPPTPTSKRGKRALREHREQQLAELTRYTKRYSFQNKRIKRAVNELKGMIHKKYPEATFALSRAVDEPCIIFLEATVDLEDTDEVLDLVMDRMMDIQLEEGLPVYVMPRQTPERIAASWREHPSPYSL